MPEWVIVGEPAGGVPVVLCEWVMEQVWLPIEQVKATNAPVLTFRDRWRAKRQSKRCPRHLTPRPIRRDRL